MTILEKSLKKCHSQLIQKHLELPARNLINYLSKDWFALSIVDSVKNLQFGSPNRFGILLQALTWAYGNPGTVESLIRICKAIYGEPSVISIDWETTNSLVVVNIQNANIYQQIGIVGNNGTEDIGLNFNGFGWTATAIVDVSSTDKKFFLQFLPVGWDLIISFN